MIQTSKVECSFVRLKLNAQRVALKLTLYRVVYNHSPFAKLMIIIFEREGKGSFIEIDLFCKSVGIGFALSSAFVHIFSFNDFIHYLEYADILNIMLEKRPQTQYVTTDLLKTIHTHTQTQYDR